MSHEDSADDSSERPAGGTRGSQGPSSARELAFTVVILLALASAVALFYPINFSATYADYEGAEVTTDLHCGSVISSTGETMHSEERQECAIARTQRIGYAGLGLAGAVALTAFTVVLPPRRARNPRV
ncbi:hypothetical protein AB5J72_22960 [Streptomyces sp. CG1]|uniref:hypothetical protein n=1 Tax=Streptomyces sp. CG1 TaxID=1287523 RepID=UPI0034E29554